MDVLTHLYREFCPVPEQLTKVVDGLEETVGASFLADGSLMTRSEVKRRAQICARWALVFRKDLKWSITRILDELPKALRCELDGISYAPTRADEQTWSQTNGRDLAWLPE